MVIVLTSIVEIKKCFIRNCSYFHFRLGYLELLFCGQFLEVLGCSANTSRDREVSDTGFELLRQISWLPFNVQPATLHNIFSRIKAHHAE